MNKISFETYMMMQLRCMLNGSNHHNDARDAKIRVERLMKENSCTVAESQNEVVMPMSEKEFMYLCEECFGDFTIGSKEMLLLLKGKGLVKP